MIITSTQFTLARRIGIEKRSNSNDDIRSNEQRAFEVIALTIENQKVDNEGSDKQTDSLEQREVERHGLIEDPAEQHDDRRNEQRDLDGRADGHADRQVHLVLRGHRHRRHVLRRVAHDRQDDQPDERLAHRRLRRHVRDRVHQELRAQCH